MLQKQGYDNWKIILNSVLKYDISSMKKNYRNFALNSCHMFKKREIICN